VRCTGSRAFVHPTCLIDEVEKSAREGRTVWWDLRCEHCNQRIKGDEGISLYERGLKMLEDVHGENEAELLPMLVAMRGVYKEAGMKEKLLALAEREVKIREAFPDNIEMARALVVLSRARMEQRDNSEARAMLERAIPIISFYGSTREVAIATNNLGAVYVAMGNTHHARTHFEKAAALLEDSDSDIGKLTGVVFANLGAEYGVAGDVRNEAEYLSNALIILGSANIPTDTGAVVARNTASRLASAENYPPRAKTRSLARLRSSFAESDEGQDDS